jgi:hypothetical protein
MKKINIVDKRKCTNLGILNFFVLISDEICTNKDAIELLLNRTLEIK